MQATQDFLSLYYFSLQDHVARACAVAYRNRTAHVFPTIFRTPLRCHSSFMPRDHPASVGDHGRRHHYLLRQNWYPDSQQHDRRACFLLRHRLWRIITAPKDAASLTTEVKDKMFGGIIFICNSATALYNDKGEAAPTGNKTELALLKWVEGIGANYRNYRKDRLEYIRNQALHALCACPVFLTRLITRMRFCQAFCLCAHASQPDARLVAPGTQVPKVSAWRHVSLHHRVSLRAAGVTAPCASWFTFLRLRSSCCSVLAVAWGCYGLSSRPHPRSLTASRTPFAI
jgi:hypothetical protein